ncbi:glycosyltransferase [Campylobacter sp. RM16192]|uniref:glycosyltransferase n=1 Tax=Campylobacter sp. RM16192 TaxID=1660080 RepID=UPI0014522B40|nr:glycosyltransferase [Campylobacter sp. RM16192]QCD52064.1 glycosyltransferase, family 1 [Campylobacter sp. RM16192]
MKKITFLRMSSKAIGGAEIYLSRLINTLENKGIKCEIKNLNAPKFLSSWIKALIYNLQVKLSKNDNFYFSLERVSSADIYRAGDGVHKVYMKSKKFWFLNPLNFVIPALEKRCFLNSKKIIANSNFIKQQIIDVYNINENKIEVIYNGVKLQEDFNKTDAKQELCKELKLDEKIPIILFVGSGFKRKGAKELLNLLSKIKSNFQAIIIGKDKNLNSYISLAKSLNLEDRVKFLGARKDVDKFYKISDILIFPTHYEPFSNVVLEALSFKNAVITTAQNGAGEILKKEFVMSSANDENILNLLEKLLNEKEFLTSIQNDNFNLAKNFSIEKNAEKTLEIINANLH